MQQLLFVVVVEFWNPFSNIFKDIRLPSFCFIMFHAQINLIESSPPKKFVVSCIYMDRIDQQTPFIWQVLKCKRVPIFHA